MQDIDDLNRHIRYCTSRDEEFRVRWSQVHRRCGAVLAAIAERTAPLSSMIGPEWEAVHQGSICFAGSLLSLIPDRDFSVNPRPGSWLRTLQPRAINQLKEHSHNRLLRGLRWWSDCPIASFYGGTKCRDAIDRCAELYRRRRIQTVDLWDAIRFRIVVPNLKALAILASNLLQDYKSQLVRCRNYYQNPRQGRHDPYRGLHFEIQYDDEDFVELQIITARREAVGCIDHAIVHKKRLPFLGRSHAMWLRAMSWSANIFDAIDSCF